MAQHEHRTGRGATAEHDTMDRRSTGVGSFLGRIAKAGLWMVLGVIVAIVVLLALIF